MKSPEVERCKSMIRTRNKAKEIFGIDLTFDKQNVIVEKIHRNELQKMYAEENNMIYVAEISPGNYVQVVYDLKLKVLSAVLPRKRRR